MHWTSAGKRVTDPAKEQLDEWFDYCERMKSAPVIHKTNRRARNENRTHLRLVENNR